MLIRCIIPNKVDLNTLGSRLKVCKKIKSLADFRKSSKQGHNVEGSKQSPKAIAKYGYNKIPKLEFQFLKNFQTRSTTLYIVAKKFTSWLST